MLDEVQIQNTKVRGRRITDDSPLPGQSLPNGMDKLNKIILLYISADELVVELCCGVDELCTKPQYSESSNMNIPSEDGTHLCFCELSSKRVEHDRKCSVLPTREGNFHPELVL